VTPVVKLKAPRQYFKPKPSPTTAIIVPYTLAIAAIVLTGIFMKVMTPVVELKAPRQYFKPKPSPTTASIVSSALSMLLLY
jgi:hypothetical protein